MENDKISIIIPVYNIHEYLDRCLQSVVCQTYKNLEVILVDDGSTDGSGQICDIWAQKDHRINSIHQKNAGVSTARNCGFENCNGNYILFLDGDDVIAPDMCEKLWKKSIESKADVCICGYFIVTQKNKTKCCSDDLEILSTEELLKSVFSNPNVGSVVWNKMFRRDILLDSRKNFISFPVDISLGEDQLWLVRIFKYCKKGVVIPETLYNWMRRNGSASNTNRPLTKKCLTVLDANELCLKEITYKSARKEAYNKHILEISDALWYAYQERNNCAQNYLIERYKNARKLWHIINPITVKRDIQVCLIQARVPYSVLMKLRESFKKIRGKQDHENLKQRAIVITIYDCYNIGNRLQNYAVQSVLQNFNFQVTTIKYPSRTIVTWKSRVKHFIQKQSGYRLPGDKTYWKSFDYKKKREEIFESFNYKYICTQEIKKVEQIEPAGYYVLGSDQVWNPTWYNELKKDLFLLTFAKPEQKVCFAPSFGLETLPEEWKPLFQTNLVDIPRLSVREDAGAKILKVLTNKEAFVMIDPTLMLDRNEWDKIASKPLHVDTERTYILTYFLGGRSEKIEQSIQEYADQLHASVYHLLDMEQPDVYATGPSEFLYLVAHAKLILTDSFHACVFSFLYGKPFLVYDRKGDNSMISRMETLLNKFNMERKYAGSGLQNDLLECDYESGYQILLEERKKAMHFLKISLHLEAE